MARLLSKKSDGSALESTRFSVKFKNHSAQGQKVNLRTANYSPKGAKNEPVGLHFTLALRHLSELLSILSASRYPENDVRILHPVGKRSVYYICITRPLAFSRFMRFRLIMHGCGSFKGVRHHPLGEDISHKGLYENIGRARHNPVITVKTPSKDDHIRAHVGLTMHSV